MKSKLSINVFEGIYFFISVATFQHTVWSGSFNFNGLMDKDLTGLYRIEWYLTGVLLAITVDFGMFICARLLAKNFSIPIALAFFVAALVSFYMQLLYMLYHSTEWYYGTGVSTYWVKHLEPFVQLRILIVPLSLPLFGTLYSFAKKNVEKINKEQNAKKIEVDGNIIEGHTRFVAGRELEIYPLIDGTIRVKDVESQKMYNYKSQNYMEGVFKRAENKIA